MNAMTRIKHLIIGVLLLLLIAGISLTFNVKAKPVLANASKANVIDPNNISVVNADGGVYWRSEPDWNTPIILARQGVYTGDIVLLECYKRGNTVPPNYNNPLWYWADIVSGYGQGSGWVNDHFLVTGTNQPNIPVEGVNPCPESSYVSSIYSDGANVRAQPDYYSRPYAYASNGYLLTIYCWADGGWADGNYLSNIWFEVSVPNDNSGLTGYINASLVYPPPNVPPCPSIA